MYDIAKIIASFNFKTLAEAKQKLEQYNTSRAEESIGAQLRVAPVYFAYLASSRAQIQRLLPYFYPGQFSALENVLKEKFSEVRERFSSLEAAEAQLGRNQAEYRVFRDLEGILDIYAVDAVKIVKEHYRTLRATMDAGLREKIEIALRIAKTRLLSSHGAYYCDEPGIVFVPRLVYAFSAFRKANVAENPFYKYISGSKVNNSTNYALVVRAFAGDDIFYGQCVKIHYQANCFLTDFFALQKAIIKQYQPMFSFAMFVDLFFEAEYMLFLEYDHRLNFRIYDPDAGSQLFLESCFGDEYRDFIIERLEYLADYFDNMVALSRLLCESGVKSPSTSYPEVKRAISCIFQFMLDFVNATYQINGALILLSRFETRVFYSVVLMYNNYREMLDGFGGYMTRIYRDFLRQLDRSTTLFVYAACYLYYDLPLLQKTDFSREFTRQFTVESYQIFAQIFESASYLQGRKNCAYLYIVQHHLESYIQIAQHLYLDNKLLIYGIFSVFEGYFDAVEIIIAKSKVYNATLKLSHLQRLPSLVEVFAVVKNAQMYQPQRGAQGVLNNIYADLENIFGYLLPISMAKLADKINYEINSQLQQKYDMVRNLSISDVIFRQQLIYRKFFANSAPMQPDVMARVLHVEDFYNSANIEKTDFYLLLQGKEVHPALQSILLRYNRVYSVIQQDRVLMTGQLLYSYLQSFSKHVRTTEDILVDDIRISTFSALYDEIERYLERPSLHFEKWLGLRQLSSAIYSLLYSGGSSVDLSSFDLLKQYYMLVDCEFSGQICSETYAIYIYIIVHCLGRVLQMRSCRLDLLVKRHSGCVELFTEDLLDLRCVGGVIDYIHGLLINFIY